MFPPIPNPSPTMKLIFPLSLLLCVLAFPVRADEDPDTDGDELTDAEEISLGTDPDKIDTDDDTLTDGYEVELGTDPLVVDSDGDELDDALEIGWTGPETIDTDGDGLTDGSEVYDYRSDPLTADSDADGLDDGGEISLGTGALLADSDADGLLDGTETILHFDPNAIDTDGNGESDPQSLVRASQPAIQLQAAGSPHQFNFTTVPFVSYDVWFSDDLLDWELLMQISASPQATPKSVAEPVAGSPRGFFNLKPH